MPQSIIQKIRISGLFNRFDHVIPENGDLSSPAILYGDNGVGKSTILNMVFHLLSAAGDQGHRTALRQIPFRTVSIALSNGTVLTAEKEDEFDEDDGVLTLQVWREGNLVAEWAQGEEGLRIPFDIDMIKQITSSLEDNPTSRTLRSFTIEHSAEEEDDHVRRGEKEYLNSLNKFAPAMFYLNADRKLDSDNVADPSEEMEFRQRLQHRGLTRITDILQASRAISLKQALSNASRWVNGRAVRSANLGSENVHSVYERVISQLAIEYNIDGADASLEEIDELIGDLDKVEQDTGNFAEYELTPKLSMENFRRSLKTGDPSVDLVSARIITPYLDSLASRLEAIRPVYAVLDDFVTIVNGFLTRKTLTFELSRGFVIVDDRGETLDAAQLSSGEQQLLLIFSHVLAARDTPSVFIIDEPEISLNIKWQRKMVDSLKHVAAGSEIQFILASHSIELVTQHMDSVVEVS